MNLFNKDAGIENLLLIQGDYKFFMFKYVNVNYFLKNCFSIFSIVKGVIKREGSVGANFSEGRVDVGTISMTAF